MVKMTHLLSLVALAWFFSTLSPDGVKLMFEYESKGSCLENRAIIVEMIGQHKGWLLSECYSDDKRT